MITKIDTETAMAAVDRMTDTVCFNGIKTGFNVLDHRMGGFSNGDLIILGGRPAMGKSTLALRMIDNVCINDGKSVLFFSRQMTKEFVAGRLLRLRNGLEDDVKLAGNKAEGKWEAISSDIGNIEKSKLWVDDSVAGDIYGAVEKARKFAKRNKIDLVIFDLWQLYQVVNLAKNDHDNRLSELQLLKQLALDLDCPVLLLSSIEITAEMREASIPDVNDLKYADIIDETADTILLMYREKYYIPDSDDDSVMIEIVKNKNCCRHFARISGNADGSFRLGLTND